MKTEPSENAFPVTQGRDFEPREWGLTKREYFTAFAMQGLIAGVRGSGDSINIKELCESAVFMADGLINALNKDTE